MFDGPNYSVAFICLAIEFISRRALYFIKEIGEELGLYDDCMLCQLV